MHTPPPSDWPKLAIEERNVSFLEMQRLCVPTQHPIMTILTSVRIACSYIDLDNGKCIIVKTVNSDIAVVEHETEHCLGRDHIGSSLIRDYWTQWKLKRKSS